MISVLNQVSDDLNKSCFSLKIRIQENSAYTGVDFSLELSFAKIVLTPGFPLQYLSFGEILSLFTWGLVLREFRATQVKLDTLYLRCI